MPASKKRKNNTHAIRKNGFFQLNEGRETQALIHLDQAFEKIQRVLAEEIVKDTKQNNSSRRTCKNSI